MTKSALIVVILILGLSLPLNADEPRRDPKTIDEILAEPSTMEKSIKELQATTNSGAGAEVTRILATLKNPFLSQLPKEEEPVPEPVKEEPPEEERGWVPPPAPVQTLPRERPKPAPVKPSYRITGLIWDTDYPQAIVQGEILTVGDQVGQWTITGIDQRGVEVTFESATFILEP